MASKSNTQSQKAFIKAFTKAFGEPVRSNNGSPSFQVSPGELVQFWYRNPEARVSRHSVKAFRLDGDSVAMEIVSNMPEDATPEQAVSFAESLSELRAHREAEGDAAAEACPADMDVEQLSYASGAPRFIWSVDGHRMTVYFSAYEGIDDTRWYVTSRDRLNEPAFDTAAEAFAHASKFVLKEDKASQTAKKIRRACDALAEEAEAISVSHGPFNSTVSLDGYAVIVQEEPDAVKISPSWIERLEVKVPKDRFETETLLSWYETVSALRAFMLDQCKTLEPSASFVWQYSRFEMFKGNMSIAPTFVAGSFEVEWIANFYSVEQNRRSLNKSYHTFEEALEAVTSVAQAAAPGVYEQEEISSASAEEISEARLDKSAQPKWVQSVMDAVGCEAVTGRDPGVWILKFSYAGVSTRMTLFSPTVGSSAGHIVVTAMDPDTGKDVLQLRFPDQKSTIGGRVRAMVDLRNELKHQCDEVDSEFDTKSCRRKGFYWTLPNGREVGVDAQGIDGVEWVLADRGEKIQEMVTASGGPRTMPPGQRFTNPRSAMAAALNILTEGRDKPKWITDLEAASGFTARQNGMEWNVDAGKIGLDGSFVIFYLWKRRGWENSQDKKYGVRVSQSMLHSSRSWQASGPIFYLRGRDLNLELLGVLEKNNALSAELHAAIAAYDPGEGEKPEIRTTTPVCTSCYVSIHGEHCSVSIADGATLDNHAWTSAYFFDRREFDSAADALEAAVEKLREVVKTKFMTEAVVPQDLNKHRDAMEQVAKATGAKLFALGYGRYSLEKKPMTVIVQAVDTKGQVDFQVKEADYYPSMYTGVQYSDEEEFRDRAISYFEVVEAARAEMLKAVSKRSPEMYDARDIYDVTLRANDESELKVFPELDGFEVVYFVSWFDKSGMNNRPFDGAEEAFKFVEAELIPSSTLLELFDSSYEWTRTEAYSGHESEGATGYVKYRFTVPGTDTMQQSTVQVKIERGEDQYVDLDDHLTEFDVWLTRTPSEPNALGKFDLGTRIGVYGDSPDAKRASIKILSTAMACVRDFVKYKNPLAIQFGGASPQHDELYEKMFSFMKADAEELGYSAHHASTPDRLPIFRFVRKPEQPLLDLRPDQVIDPPLNLQPGQALNELFDSSFPWTVREWDDPTDWSEFSKTVLYEFTFGTILDVGKSTVRVKFLKENEGEENEPDDAKSNFEVMMWRSIPKIGELGKEEKPVFTMGMGKFGNSPEAKRIAIKVLGTVVAIFKDFMKTRSPMKISFGGYSKDHEELYRSMMDALRADAAELGYEASQRGYTLTRLRTADGKPLLVLKELFDNPFTWEKTVGQLNTDYRFRVPGTETSEESMGIVTFSSAGDKWFVAFMRTARNKDGERTVTYDVNAFGDSPEAKRMAIRVISTVVAIVVDFLKANKPQAIYFTAAQEAQDKLYTTLFKSMSSDLNKLGYKHGKDGTRFVIDRKKGWLWEQRIDELFDNPFPWNKVQLNGLLFEQGIEYSFGLPAFEGHVEGLVTVTFSKRSSIMNEWSVIMKRKITDKAQRELDRLEGSNGMSMGIGSDGSFGTGPEATRLSAKVLGTVIAIFRDFLETKKPSKVEFTGASNEHDNMYESLLSALSSRIDDLGYRANGKWGNFKIKRKGIFGEARLDELFDSSLPFTRTVLDADKLVGGGVVDGIDYKFEAPECGLVKASTVTLQFTCGGDRKKARPEDIERAQAVPGEYSAYMSRTYTTMFGGTGNAISLGMYGDGPDAARVAVKVLGTIVACFKDFLEFRKPEEVYWVGYTKEHTELYASMVDRLSAAADGLGYTATYKKGDDYFVVKKKSDAKPTWLQRLGLAEAKVDEWVVGSARQAAAALGSEVEPVAGVAQARRYSLGDLKFAVAPYGPRTVRAMLVEGDGMKSLSNVFSIEIPGEKFQRMGDILVGHAELVRDLLPVVDHIAEQLRPHGWKRSHRRDSLVGPDGSDASLTVQIDSDFEVDYALSVFGDVVEELYRVLPSPGEAVEACIAATANMPLREAATIKDARAGLKIFAARVGSTVTSAGDVCYDRYGRQLTCVVWRGLTLRVHEGSYGSFETVVHQKLESDEQVADVIEAFSDAAHAIVGIIQRMREALKDDGFSLYNGVLSSQRHQVSVEVAFAEELEVQIDVHYYDSAEEEAMPISRTFEPDQVDEAIEFAKAAGELGGQLNEASSAWVETLEPAVAMAAKELRGTTSKSVFNGQTWYKVTAPDGIGISVRGDVSETLLMLAGHKDYNDDISMLMQEHGVRDAERVAGVMVSFHDSVKRLMSELDEAAEGLPTFRRDVGIAELYDEDSEVAIAARLKGFEISYLVQFLANAEDGFKDRSFGNLAAAVAYAKENMLNEDRKEVIADAQFQARCRKVANDMKMTWKRSGKDRALLSGDGMHVYVQKLGDDGLAFSLADAAEKEMVATWACREGCFTGMDQWLREYLPVARKCLEAADFLRASLASMGFARTGLMKLANEAHGITISIGIDPEMQGLITMATKSGSKTYRVEQDFEVAEDAMEAVPMTESKLTEAPVSPELKKEVEAAAHRLGGTSWITEARISIDNLPLGGINVVNNGGAGNGTSLFLTFYSESFSSAGYRMEVPNAEDLADKIVSYYDMMTEVMEVHKQIGRRLSGRGFSSDLMGYKNMNNAFGRDVAVRLFLLESFTPIVSVFDMTLRPAEETHFDIEDYGRACDLALDLVQKRRFDEAVVFNQDPPQWLRKLAEHLGAKRVGQFVKRTGQRTPSWWMTLSDTAFELDVSITPSVTGYMCSVSSHSFSIHMQFEGKTNLEARVGAAAEMLPIVVEEYKAAREKHGYDIDRRFLNHMGFAAPVGFDLRDQAIDRPTWMIWPVQEYDSADAAFRAFAHQEGKEPIAEAAVDGHDEDSVFANMQRAAKIMKGRAEKATDGVVGSFGRVSAKGLAVMVNYRSFPIANTIFFESYREGAGYTGFMMKPNLRETDDLAEQIVAYHELALSVDRDIMRAQTLLGGPDKFDRMGIDELYSDATGIMLIARFVAPFEFVWIVECREQGMDDVHCDTVDEAIEAVKRMMQINEIHRALEPAMKKALSDAAKALSGTWKFDDDGYIRTERYTLFVGVSQRQAGAVNVNYAVKWKGYGDFGLAINVLADADLGNLAEQILAYHELVEAADFEMYKIEGQLPHFRRRMRFGQLTDRSDDCMITAKAVNGFELEFEHWCGGELFTGSADEVIERAKQQALSEAKDTPPKWAQDVMREIGATRYSKGSSWHWFNIDTPDGDDDIMVGIMSHGSMFDSCQFTCSGGHGYSIRFSATSDKARWPTIAAGAIELRNALKREYLAALDETPFRERNSMQTFNNPYVRPEVKTLDDVSWVCYNANGVTFHPTAREAFQKFMEAPNVLAEATADDRRKTAHRVGREVAARLGSQAREVDSSVGMFYAIETDDSETFVSITVGASSTHGKNDLHVTIDDTGHSIDDPSPWYMTAYFDSDSYAVDRIMAFIEIRLGLKAMLQDLPDGWAANGFTIGKKYGKSKVGQEVEMIIHPMVMGDLEVEWRVNRSRGRYLEGRMESDLESAIAVADKVAEELLGKSALMLEARAPSVKALKAICKEAAARIGRPDPDFPQHVMFESSFGYVEVIPLVGGKVNLFARGSARTNASQMTIGTTVDDIEHGLRSFVDTIEAMIEAFKPIPPRLKELEQFDLISMKHRAGGPDNDWYIAMRLKEGTFEVELSVYGWYQGDHVHKRFEPREVDEAVAFARLLLNYGWTPGGGGLKEARYSYEAPKWAVKLGAAVDGVWSGSAVMVGVEGEDRYNVSSARPEMRAEGYKYMYNAEGITFVLRGKDLIEEVRSAHETARGLADELRDAADGLELPDHDLKLEFCKLSAVCNKRPRVGAYDGDVRVKYWASFDGTFMWTTRYKDYATAREAVRAMIEGFLEPRLRVIDDPEDDIIMLPESREITDGAKKALPKVRAAIASAARAIGAEHGESYDGGWIDHDGVGTRIGAKSSLVISMSSGFSAQTATAIEFHLAVQDWDDLAEQILSYRELVVAHRRLLLDAMPAAWREVSFGWCVADDGSGKQVYIRQSSEEHQDFSISYVASGTARGSYETAEEAFAAVARLNEAGASPSAGEDQASDSDPDSQRSIETLDVSSPDLGLAFEQFEDEASMKNFEALVTAMRGSSLAQGLALKEAPRDWVGELSKEFGEPADRSPGRATWRIDGKLIKVAKLAGTDLSLWRRTDGITKFVVAVETGDSYKPFGVPGADLRFEARAVLEKYEGLVAEFSAAFEASKEAHPEIEHTRIHELVAKLEYVPNTGSTHLGSYSTLGDHHWEAFTLASGGKLRKYDTALEAFQRITRVLSGEELNEAELAEALTKPEKALDALLRTACSRATRAVFGGAAPKNGAQYWTLPIKNHPHGWEVCLVKLKHGNDAVLTTADHEGYTGFEMPLSYRLDGAEKLAHDIDSYVELVEACAAVWKRFVAALSAEGLLDDRAGISQCGTHRGDEVHLKVSGFDARFEVYPVSVEGGGDWKLRYELDDFDGAIAKLRELAGWRPLDEAVLAEATDWKAMDACIRSAAKLSPAYSIVNRPESDLWVAALKQHGFVVHLWLDADGGVNAKFFDESGSNSFPMTLPWRVDWADAEGLSETLTSYAEVCMAAVNVADELRSSIAEKTGRKPARELLSGGRWSTPTKDVTVRVLVGEDGGFDAHIRVLSGRGYADDAVRRFEHDELDEAIAYAVNLISDRGDL